jgi:hypothetical protein
MTKSVSSILFACVEAFRTDAVSATYDIINRECGYDVYNNNNGWLGAREGVVKVLCAQLGVDYKSSAHNGFNDWLNTGHDSGARGFKNTDRLSLFTLAAYRALGDEYAAIAERVRENAKYLVTIEGVDVVWYDAPGPKNDYAGSVDGVRVPHPNIYSDSVHETLQRYDENLLAYAKEKGTDAAFRKFIVAARDAKFPQPNAGPKGDSGSNPKLLRNILADGKAQLTHTDGGRTVSLYWRVFGESRAWSGEWIVERCGPTSTKRDGFVVNKGGDGVDEFRRAREQYLSYVNGRNRQPDVYA